MIKLPPLQAAAKSLLSGLTRKSRQPKGKAKAKATAAPATGPGNLSNFSNQVFTEKLSFDVRWVHGVLPILLDMDLDDDREKWTLAEKCGALFASAPSSPSRYSKWLLNVCEFHSAVSSLSQVSYSCLILPLVDSAFLFVIDWPPRRSVNAAGLEVQQEVIALGAWQHYVFTVGVVSRAVF